MNKNNNKKKTTKTPRTAQSYCLVCMVYKRVHSYRMYNQFTGNALT